MKRLGIDLGGTKIAACLLDAQGKEMVRLRAPTPKGDYVGTIAAIARLVKEIEAQCGRADSIGIGFPGSVSRATGLHRNANSTCLNGQDLLGDLGRALGREVRGANDANCLALSEAFDGAAAQGRVVFAAILGTGVGGGVVVDRRIIEGRNAIGGEWGHSPMPASDPVGREARPCYCGRSGCIEQFLAGPALEAEHASRFCGAIGTPRATLDEIDRRSRGGSDAAAAATIDSLCERLAEALSSVVNLLDPDVIVLGGGVSNVRAIYERVPALVREKIFSDCFETPLVAAQFGDSSGVRGAARLWDMPA